MGSGIGAVPFKCVVAPSGMPINNKLSLIDLHLRSIMSSRNSAISSFNFVFVVLSVLSSDVKVAIVFVLVSVCVERLSYLPLMKFFVPFPRVLQLYFEH